MCFSWSPKELELIANKFAHDPMNPHVCDGIKIFAIHDPDQWLVVSYYCKFGSSQVQTAFLYSPLNC